MKLACPVCRAGFRGTRECSRCGADLEPLMRLAAGAYRLRQEARQALAAGEGPRAAALARRAVGLHDTPQGRSLHRAALVPPERVPEPTPAAPAERPGWGPRWLRAVRDWLVGA